MVSKTEAKHIASEIVDRPRSYLRPEPKPAKLSPRRKEPYVASYDMAADYLRTYYSPTPVTGDNFAGCFHMLGNMRIIMYRGHGDLHIYRINDDDTMVDLPIRWDHKMADWVYIFEATTRSQINEFMDATALRSKSLEIKEVEEEEGETDKVELEVELSIINWVSPRLSHAAPREHLQLRLKDGFLSELLRRAPLNPRLPLQLLEVESLATYRRRVAHALAQEVAKALYLKFEKFLNYHMDPE